MRPGAGLYKIYAGTGVCVHTPFRLNPTASLAWLGKQLPCPVQKVEVYIYTDGPPAHTHTPCRSRVGEMNMKWNDDANGMASDLTGKTNTNTPSPERANPERAREKKKRTDDGPNTDQRRGGGRKRLTLQDATKWCVHYRLDLLSMAELPSHEACSKPRAAFRCPQPRSPHRKIPDKSRFIAGEVLENRSILSLGRPIWWVSMSTKRRLMNQRRSLLAQPQKNDHCRIPWPGSMAKNQKFRATP